MASCMGVIKEMKLLIIGDSYAVNFSELYWTAIIEKQFDCEVENHALPASSVSYSYKKLTHALKKNKYDVVIVALTSADRPYHRNMLIHGGFPQYNDGTPVSKEIQKAIQSYYVHLYDIENTVITHSMFCRALAQLSLEYMQTKFIFLPAFDEFEKVRVGNCVITNQRLIHYSMLDQEGHAAEVRGECVEKPNHLTFFQNQTLANYIITFINDYIFGRIVYKNIKNMEILK